ncbi:hypothetical protein V1525DRAFT_409134 [Lipomyces kononenkoae]|uniref:Uncharacterized protein n=1 Tax=Lipomyces kononenkoae TaxID=34357 RepID=A0ACC3SVM0_LIPKO
MLKCECVKNITHSWTTLILTILHLFWTHASKGTSFPKELRDSNNSGRLIVEALQLELHREYNITDMDSCCKYIYETIY